MFERVFVETLETSRRPLTVSLSALAQCVVLGVGVLMPLLSGLELPAGRWAAHLLAPVPPSAPPSPGPAQRAKAVVPRAAPTLSAMPDKAAAIIDTTEGAPASESAASPVSRRRQAFGEVSVPADCRPPCLLRPRPPSPSRQKLPPTSPSASAESYSARSWSAGPCHAILSRLGKLGFRASSVWRP